VTYSESLFDEHPDARQMTVGDGDNSPVEHADLPRPSVRTTGGPILRLSFDTEEEREELVRLLGLEANRGREVWSAYWPEPPDDGSLRLDV
jgi:hypothetical protein